MFGNVTQYIKNGELALPEELIEYPDSLLIEGQEDLVSLGNLRSVNGSLSVKGCPNLQTTGDLQSVNGIVHVSNCPELEFVQGLRSARGSVSFGNSKVEKLADDFELVRSNPHIPTIVTGLHLTSVPDEYTKSL